MLTLDDRAPDPMIEWAAGRPRARVWRRAGAVAVACPDLARRDRLVLHGDPDALADLLPGVLAEAGPAFRPVADQAVLEAVAERVPGLRVAGRFGWMDTTEPPACGGGDPRWLGPGELPEVTALLDTAFPESYARPGGTGVHRWAGLRDADGSLLAVAADAWSTDRIGFVAGVATRPGARGRGLAATLCAFVTRELLAGRSRVALLVDNDNAAALATYAKLGFTLRPVAAAHPAVSG